MSVGHIARIFEESGLITTAIYVAAFAHYADAMRLPRVAITPHPMGRPLGPPGDAGRHREVVDAALGLVDSAERRASLEVGGEYRPHRGEYLEAGSL